MSWLDSHAVTASIPVIASLGTLALSQIYSRRTAEADRSHMTETARADRRFQAREARYADRRLAVVEFLVAANDEADAVARFEREHRREGLAPFDLHDEYEFTKLNQAHARLAILVPTELVVAADAVRRAVFACFAGEEHGWRSYNASVAELQASARAMLNEDAGASDLAPDAE